MPQLVYGVWDGIVYDNRGAGVPASPQGLDLALFDQFNEGNPARIFLSERGFLVFSPDAPLLWALWKHFDKVASECATLPNRWPTPRCAEWAKPAPAP